MTGKGLTTFRLARRVRTRERQIERFMKFLVPLLIKRGKVVQQRVESSYTHTERELENFSNFSFFFVSGLSMMGGQYIKVWYHPGSSSVDMKKVPPTLQVSGDVKFEVENFNEDPAWQRALSRVIRNKDKIIARRDERQQREELRRKQERDREQKRADLEKKAERLNIL